MPRPSEGLSINRTNKLSPLKHVLLMLAVSLPPSALVGGGLVYSANHQPKERIVYQDKIVYRQPGGQCMSPTEVGRVIDARTEEYDISTKDDPKAIQIDTHVSFRMSDGTTRVCNWDHVDMSIILEKDSVVAAKGGTRVL